MGRRIYIAYTGGTIGMRRHAGGYVPGSGLQDALREALPARFARDAPEFVLGEYPDPIDSASADPGTWTRIARDLVAHHDDFDGFVVLHGTDTMAFTASALSFMLGGLDRPVILTGSQIPLGELRNDATNNLLTALILAAEHPVPEVCVYFDGRLLRGNRTTKVRAQGFDAFDSPNHPPLGRVGIRIDVDRSEPWVAREPSGFRVPDLHADRVVVLKVFPGIQGAWLRRALAPPVAGVVLETYGVGNAPDRDGALLEALAAACRRGVVAVAVSQCPEGAVDVGAYAAGAALARCGVVGGGDMTTEAAFTKLHFLLGLGMDPEASRAAMAVSLRGELTP